MSDDWRDHEPGRTGVSVAQLGDGESVVVDVLSEPFREETDADDSALHLPVLFLETPDRFEDMSGEPVALASEADEAGEEPEEYNVINSSTAFFDALMEHFHDAPVAGQSLVIEVQQPGDVYTRSYRIEPA